MSEGEYIRVSDEEFRSVYEQGFKVWGELYQRVAEDPKLPPDMLFGGILSQRHPPLPPNLDLRFNRKGAFATGVSLWESEGPDCSHTLPTFPLPVSVKVATRDPTTLSVSHTENVAPYMSYFARDDDYISLLILAWTYILSARWAETMPGACSFSYTNIRAMGYDELTDRNSGEKLTSVYLDKASPEEARWWAAVLSPGQGWQAIMMREQETLISPWSIRLQNTSPLFLLHATSVLPSSEEAASFTDASNYLQVFCTRHNVTDQSRAALATVLLLPSMSNLKELMLPALGMRQLSDATEVPLDTLWTENEIVQKEHIDRLMTLSCHTRGIRPILLSAFYEPGIECNAVTPWLQGALAAISQLTGSNACIVSRMCMERAPQTAFLWLGTLILGEVDKLLQEVRFGQLPVDLSSAAWSGTIQTFLQEPVSKPLVMDGRILRADECRLLFLSQYGHHSRTPVCQWKPFGTSAVEDVDIEVRVHEPCKGHQLQYKGVLWECAEGKCESLPFQEEPSHKLFDMLQSRI